MSVTEFESTSVALLHVENYVLNDSNELVSISVEDHQSVFRDADVIQEATISNDNRTLNLSLKGGVDQQFSLEELLVASPSSSSRRVVGPRNGPANSEHSTFGHLPHSGSIVTPDGNRLPVRGVCVDADRDQLILPQLVDSKVAAEYVHSWDNCTVVGSAELHALDGSVCVMIALEQPFEGESDCIVLIAEVTRSNPIMVKQALFQDVILQSPTGSVAFLALPIPDTVLCYSTDGESTVILTRLSRESLVHPFTFAPAKAWMKLGTNLGAAQCCSLDMSPKIFKVIIAGRSGWPLSYPNGLIRSAEGADGNNSTGPTDVVVMVQDSGVVSLWVLDYHVDLLEKTLLNCQEVPLEKPSIGGIDRLNRETCRTPSTSPQLPNIEHPIITPFTSARCSSSSSIFKSEPKDLPTPMGPLIDKSPPASLFNSDKPRNTKSAPTTSLGGNILTKPLSMTSVGQNPPWSIDNGKQKVPVESKSGTLQGTRGDDASTREGSRRGEKGSKKPRPCHLPRLTTKRYVSPKSTTSLADEDQIDQLLSRVDQSTVEYVNSGLEIIDERLAELTSAERIAHVSGIHSRALAASAQADKLYQSMVLSNKMQSLKGGLSAQSQQIDEAVSILSSIPAYVSAVTQRPSTESAGDATRLPPTRSAPVGDMVLIRPSPLAADALISRRSLVYNLQDRTNKATRSVEAALTTFKRRSERLLIPPRSNESGQEEERAQTDYEGCICPTVISTLVTNQVDSICQRSRNRNTLTNERQTWPVVSFESTEEQLLFDRGLDIVKNWSEHKGPLPQLKPITTSAPSLDGGYPGPFAYDNPQQPTTSTTSTTAIWNNQDNKQQPTTSTTAIWNNQDNKLQPIKEVENIETTQQHLLEADLIEVNAYVQALLERWIQIETRVLSMV
eukprot:GHVH01013404.1.p1 GENE.GHVH01013404.1~~GHVH01013404.1.p1  ORF type:complete len:899 (+),score=104.94 GHVH01013404.1:80-2776(+)